MKKFNDLLEIIDILEEGAESREKAKDFKSKMKPVINKMKHAQIGDPRRYAYQLLWRFLRDELGIEDIQDQDTPVNSAVIQRKLEDLADAGSLPEDAGARFEQYANDQFDQFVDTVSTTKRKTSLKSHYRGGDVASHLNVAGDGTGWTEGESASERARRTEEEQKLQALNKQEGSVDIKTQFQQAVNDIADTIDPKDAPGIRELPDTIEQQDTTMIEIFVDPNEGPIVQKKGISALFPASELADEIDIGSKNITVVLKPDSMIAQQIQSKGADRIEEFLRNRLEGLMSRSVQVVIHEPETESPVPGAIKALTGEEDEQRSYNAEASFTLPSGPVVVHFYNGRVIEVVSDRGAQLEFDVDSINSDLKSGVDIETALNNAAQGVEVALQDSVMRYMPTPDAQIISESAPANLITTRDRFKPTSHHQMEQYRRMTRGI